MAKSEQSNSDNINRDFVPVAPRYPTKQEQQEELKVDPYDNATLRRLAPEAFGPLSFDPVTAQLLVRGYFVPPHAAAALRIRVEAELTGHFSSHGGASGHQGHRNKDKWKKSQAAAVPSVAAGEARTSSIKPSTALVSSISATHSSAHAKTAADDVDEPGDRAPWDDEMTRVVVDLHARRVSFKNISGYIPGKGVKACQEHYYRVIKNPRWKERHDKNRREHDHSSSEDRELQTSAGGSSAEI